jgi:hypothetical protein
MDKIIKKRALISHMEDYQHKSRSIKVFSWTKVTYKGPKTHKKCFKIISSRWDLLGHLELIEREYHLKDQLGRSS